MNISKGTMNELFLNLVALRESTEISPSSDLNYLIERISKGIYHLNEHAVKEALKTEEKAGEFIATIITCLATPTQENLEKLETNPVSKLARELHMQEVMAD